MKFHPVEVDYGEDDENLKEAMGKAVAPGERRYLRAAILMLVSGLHSENQRGHFPPRTVQLKTGRV
jgi:hypothetical protein